MTLVLKKWKPRHELMVFLHLRGKKNVEIAETIGVTPEYVCQVLAAPKALQMIDNLRSELREGFVESMEEQLMELGPSAIGNLKKTLDAEIPVGSKRKKHQDNMSFKLLDRIGFTPKRRDGDTGSDGLKLDRDIQERMAKAMERSREIEEYDAMEEEEWEDAVEVDAELVDEQD